jgi:hypothetical protein
LQNRLLAQVKSSRSINRFLILHGRLIILDDYFNEMWSGVSEGVHRYFREPRGILPFATGANKTFFCRFAALDRHQDT